MTEVEISRSGGRCACEGCHALIGVGLGLGLELWSKSKWGGRRIVRQVGTEWIYGRSPTRYGREHRHMRWHSRILRDDVDKMRRKEGLRSRDLAWLNIQTLQLRQQGTLHIPIWGLMIIS